MESRSLPENSGVYQFLGENDEVLYVGKAKNLRNRVSSYFAKSSELGPKTEVLISKVKKIRTIEVNSEIESLLLEASLIKKYNPQFNIRLTDGKAYPLIRITVKNQFPAVLTARRPDDKKSIYFGPFPNAGDMKLVLRTIRRIFPYLSTQNHSKKYCLYWHLGLCPCTPVDPTEEAKREYRKTIRHIAQFLDGNIEKVVKELQKEQKEYVKQEEFEKAAQIQSKISAIEKITTKSTNPNFYEINPDLVSDIREKEANELLEALRSKGVGIGTIHKIECYDISNISGTNATGSLVVFVDGEADKSQYRRFKIRFFKDGPNDFAMMKEVLTRRFKHDEWIIPDLMVIDGGKGQVGAAMTVLKELNKNIALIGLAKRFETIVLPDFTEIKLSHRTGAVKLLQRIRNEAHRFAITYHRKLRSKASLT